MVDFSCSPADACLSISQAEPCTSPHLPPWLPLPFQVLPPPGIQHSPFSSQTLLFPRGAPHCSPPGQGTGRHSLLTPLSPVRCSPSPKISSQCIFLPFLVLKFSEKELYTHTHCHTHRVNPHYLQISYL